MNAIIENFNYVNLLKIDGIGRISHWKKYVMDLIFIIMLEYDYKINFLITKLEVFYI